MIPPGEGNILFRLLYSRDRLIELDRQTFFQESHQLRMIAAQTRFDQGRQTLEEDRSDLRIELVKFSQVSAAYA
jgi:hypothetical protein